MKALEAGYLQRRDDKHNSILFTTSVLLYQSGGLLYCISLELGIMSHGKNRDEAFQSLVVLIEDDLLFRAQSKIQIEVVPAQEKYFMAFQRLMKGRGKPPETTKDFNSLAKKIKKMLNPESPANYGVLQPVA